MRHPFLLLHPAKACAEAAAAKQALEQLQQHMTKAGLIGPCILSLQMSILKNRRSGKLIRYGMIRESCRKSASDNFRKVVPTACAEDRGSCCGSTSLAEALVEALFSILRIPSKSLWRWKVRNSRRNSAVMCLPPILALYLKT